MAPDNARLPPRLHELVGRAREITDTIVAANAEREDLEATWPEPAMKAFAEAGLLGLNVAPDLGGHGEGMLGLLAVTETIGRESGSTALCYAMHCVGTAVLGAKATEYHKQQYLEPMSHRR